MKKERFDWESFWDSFPWWGVLIGLLILGSVITSIIEATKPEIPKQPAVVIEYVDDAPFDHYKVQFLDDRSVRMEDLEDGISVGDTILLKK